MRKHVGTNASGETDQVSVPLRGLDMRKLWAGMPLGCQRRSFSPLAGIRYAETVGAVQ